MNTKIPSPPGEGRREPTLIVIAGPTAIGKTAAAIQIAQKYNTEIISADSRQFYKEMSIGTAKPSTHELAAVKHHFIDSHHINEPFSVGSFEEQGLKLLDELFKNYDIIVMAGGSGLYMNAVCNGFDDLPKADPEIRNKLNLEYREKGIAYLQAELKAKDPAYYAEVDLFNPQRMIRALEVYHTSGIPFSSYRTKQHKTRSFKIIKIGLNTNREQLYTQINNRVDEMIEMGLANEVKKLTPYRNLNALNTVGYSELFSYLDGMFSLDEAVDKIKQNTRRFAKRQLTWFKKDQEINWFEPSDLQVILNFLDVQLGVSP
jgi:tRNA dimethylallyltransferase